MQGSELSPSVSQQQQGQQGGQQQHQSSQQQMNRQNFQSGPGSQNDADIAELFSPVSESSNIGQPGVGGPSGGGGGQGPGSQGPPGNSGMFDDGSRIPMSPYSSSAGGMPTSIGGPMMGGPGGMPPHQMRPQYPPQGPHPMYQPGMQGPPGGYMRGGPMHPQHMPPHGPQFQPGHPIHGAHMMPPGMGGSGGKIYPPDQPMVFNSTNPNAPPIYPCGVCHKEIHDNDQAILCESGCNFWFHRSCTGLTDIAYLMLTKEVYAEWVCDKCLSTGSVPLVKMKS